MIGEPDHPHHLLLTEHVFKKLRSIDLALREFLGLLDGADDVIEATEVADGVKEVLLVVAWRHPLHVVVVIDDRKQERRVITVYIPNKDQWSSDYRRRR